MRVSDAGWSLNVAPGWIVVGEPDRRLTVLYRRPTIARDTTGCALDQASAVLGIGVIQYATDTMEEHAEAEVVRFAGEGLAERFDIDIGGLPVLGFDYTNGDAEVRSLYAELSPGLACCITLTLGSADEESQVEAEEMITSITWT